jgi:Tfp pilus assembly protein PilO
MSVTRKWSALAVVLVLAILAAGWFLLVSPKRTEAAGLETQVDTQEAANAKLVSELEQLKAQQAELPAQRAELASMRKQIPDNPALPTLIRSLTEAGRKVGVSIDTMSPTVPVAVVDPAAEVAAAPATTTSESDSLSQTSDSSTTDSTEGSADSTTATVAAPAAPTLYQVPLTLEVSGSYFELEQFINKLEGLKRSFLVTGFTLAPATESGSDTTDAGPAPDDLTLSLQGRVFLSPPASTTATQQTPVAPATSGQ